MKLNYTLRTLFPMLVLLLACPRLVDAQWTKETPTVYSQSFDQNLVVGVCLPTGYDPSRPTPYATIYLLGSGAGVSCSTWFSLTDYDAPIVVGLGDGATTEAREQLTWKPLGWPWVNSDLIGPFEDLVFDVIEYVDATYNTFGTREKRAVIGSSISAGGAARMGLKYHDTFAALTASDGFPDLGHLYEGSFRAAVLGENSGPPYDFRPQACCSGTYFAFQMASGLSPNLSNPPYYIDFPFDTDGNVDESVKQRWLSNHGPRYAKLLPPTADVKIWIDYNPNDPHPTALSSIAFRDSLDALGLPYQHLVHSCGHVSCSNLKAVHDARSRFLVESLDLRATDTRIEEGERPGSFLLHQNYPNPFNPSTRIEYEVLQSGRVEVVVHDMLGRRVATPYSGYQSIGTHSLEWTAPAETPSGAYFYTLRTSLGSATRLMILQE